MRDAWVSAVLVLGWMLIFLTGSSIADVNLFDSVGNSLNCTGAYAIQIASIINFEPVTGPAFFAGDQCNFNLNASSFPNGSIIFFFRSACDEGLPLQRFAQLSSRIGAVVELFGSEDAILENGPLDVDPNDLPPRFLFDPRPAKESLIVVRISGSNAGRTARFLHTGNAVNATVYYTPDPWKAMYYRPEWIAYEAVIIIFFCIYIPQHAIRSLIVIYRKRRKLPAHARSHGMNLQTVMMCAALALGFVRIIECSTETLRDYGDIWSPELVSQLAWGYGYYILLMSMLLLVLFWADVLKTSRVKLLMIDRVTTRFYIIFGIGSFLLLTACICIYVFQLSGTGYVKDAGFLMLGCVALLESFGTLIYGGRLLKQLTDVKPIAERGVMQRSPSITENYASSDNPVFDPTMNRGSQRGSKKNPRSSLVKELSSSKVTNSDDSDEKRAAKMASKRAKPLTRLVLVSGVLLLCATAISAYASFSTLLNSPNTYSAVFWPLACVEIPIYVLIVNTMSPIWQERRRRLADRAAALSESRLGPLSENRASFSEPPAAEQPSLPRRVCAFLYLWFVI